jgi:hypothetical protein
VFVKEAILEIGRDLPIGASVYATCPKCQAQEKKLSVTRYEDGLGWVCFRASCGVKGAVSDTGYVSRPAERAPAKKKFEPRNYTGLLQGLHGYGLELADRISMGRPGYWGVWSAGPDAVYYLLEDFTGKARGWTVRTRGKSITSGKYVDRSLYGYYTDPQYIARYTPQSVWFVEDPLSAIRLAEADKSAVALLGTHASDGMLNEMWDEYPSLKRVYVALDPGAEDAARKIVTKCRFEYGLDAIQVLLPDDIHRLDSATFKSVLEAYP